MAMRQQILTSDVGAKVTLVHAAKPTINLDRVDELRRQFELEAARTLEIIRAARRDLFCAHDKLHNGLALEIYSAKIRAPKGHGQ